MSDAEVSASDAEVSASDAEVSASEFELSPDLEHLQLVREIDCILVRVLHGHTCACVRDCHPRMALSAKKLEFVSRCLPCPLLYSLTPTLTLTSPSSPHPQRSSLPLHPDHLATVAAVASAADSTYACELTGVYRISTWPKTYPFAAEPNKHPEGAATLDLVRQSTCKVCVGHVFVGTGCLCVVHGHGPCLLTSNHVMPTPKEAAVAKAKLATTSVSPSTTNVREFALDPDHLFACCVHPTALTTRGDDRRRLDWTLVALRERRVGTPLPSIDRTHAPEIPSIGEKVYIFHHPGGGQLRSTVGFVTAVESPFVFHSATTGKGSSGALGVCVSAGGDARVCFMHQGGEPLHVGWLFRVWSV